MNPLDALERYLEAVRRRWQLTVTARGAGVVAVAALLLTLIVVVVANQFAFASWSITGGRALLFGALAAILAVLLIRPLVRAHRRGGHRLWVRPLERGFPAFEERVQTFLDQKEDHRGNPIVHLLAEDTMRLAAEAPPSRILSWRTVGAFAGAGLAAIVALIWLGVAGPGYLGYGTARLWGGWLKPSVSNLYQIVVGPGSVTIRRKADLHITAHTIGFESPTARLFAKYKSNERWEEASMHRRIDDSGFEFVFAGVEEPLHYYIAAGGVKSAEYEVRVVEMPNVKKLRVTYHYPSWTGLPQSTEEDTGDVRAVGGTEVDVEIETDRPLAEGLLRIDGQQNRSLEAQGNRSRGRLTVSKDGQYFIGALHNGELVRLTDDYFIVALPDEAPKIRVARPGRDHKATSIEEVTVHLEADDDYGLRSLELHYAVNGGEPAKINVASSAGRKLSGGHTFLLENLSLVPGDVIAYYASARDARAEAKTDMYFVEVRPFEREFSQSQMAGGGGGGGNDEASQIPQRQKEILAAAWNLAREKKLDKPKAAEHAKTLSGIQTTLRDQSRTLAERMKRREMAGVNNEFKAFVENMEKAAENMGPAAEKLSQQKWEEALAPGQKALQHLLRAEAIFRDIQVAFGSGGGGGGGSMGRDLAEMFELELDTEKNQYETARNSPAEQREKEIDEALEKLRELARRQEQLAEQERRRQQLSFDQRWQQEMLRREAEDLTRRLQEMQRQQQQQGSQQNAGSRQQGQQGQQGGQPGSQQGRLQQALDRLQQATRDMQSAGGARPPSEQQAGAQGNQQQQAARERALQRLREAEDLLAGERRQRAGEDLRQMEQQAEDLARRQQQVAEPLQEALKKAMEEVNAGRRVSAQGVSTEQGQALAKEKEKMMAEIEALERRMQETARRLATTQRGASQQLRQTVGRLQENQLRDHLRTGAEWLRRDMGLYAAQREDKVTEGINQLRDGLREARRQAQSEQPGSDSGMERALQRVEQLRQQLEQAMAAQRGQQGQQPGQQQGNQQGQQGQQGQGQQGQGQGGQQGDGRQNGGPGDRGASPIGGRQDGGWQRGGDDASNRGDWRPNLPSGVQPADPTRAFRDGRVELSQIERALRSDPEFAREVEALRREMERLPMTASRFPGNPALLNKEQQKLMHEVEQLELMLRRKVEEKQGAQVRAATEQPVPENYRKAVAEYFRRLSKEK